MRIPLIISLLVGALLSVGVMIFAIQTSFPGTLSLVILRVFPFRSS